MGQLWNKTKNLQLAENVEAANDFIKRSKGLLGRNTFPRGSALWISQCNSIHTWFMKFSIDAVFVDKQLRVRAAYMDIKPWRLIWPIWGAQSVFEFSAGQISSQNIHVGDLLDVRS